MTEADWLSCADPQAMLRWLGPPSWARSGRRKLRLFAAGCCRRHWPLLTAEGRQAVELMEAIADGRADEEEKKAYLSGGTSFSSGGTMAHLFASSAISYLLLNQGTDVVVYARGISSWAASASTSRAAEQAAQADILRDVLGVIPFRPPTWSVVDRRWIDWDGGTVCKLAQAIYDERAFERLPIVADALEEAGCTEEWILQHARQGGSHFRGCWLVDVLRAADGQEG